MHACSVGIRIVHDFIVFNICSVNAACMLASVACGLHATYTQCVSLACLHHSCVCGICRICVQVSVACVQLECYLPGACIHRACMQCMCIKLVTFLHVVCLCMYECNFTI